MLSSCKIENNVRNQSCEIIFHLTKYTTRKDTVMREHTTKKQGKTEAINITQNSKRMGTQLGIINIMPSEEV